jgi:hypothetical protein
MSMLFNPLQEVLPSCFKGFNVRSFCVCHAVAGDMNFKMSRLTFSRPKQETMPRMEAVKGSADQTSLKGVGVLHEQRLGPTAFEVIAT